MPRFLFALAFLLAQSAFAANKAELNDSEKKPLPGITEKTRGMRAMPGFVNLYWDARAGKVWLEIAKFDSEFLYVASLAAGVGSNDIGLDRGQFGDLEGSARPEHLVRFERIGPKVLLVEQNLSYRAVTETRTKSAPWRRRSRARCSGDSRSRQRRMAACWSMRLRFFCTTPMAWRRS